MVFFCGLFADPMPGLGSPNRARETCCWVRAVVPGLTANPANKSGGPLVEPPLARIATDGAVIGERAAWDLNHKVT
jgi:hypothetical protein